LHHFVLVIFSCHIDICLLLINLPLSLKSDNYLPNSEAITTCKQNSKPIAPITAKCSNRRKRVVSNIISPLKTKWKRLSTQFKTKTKPQCRTNITQPTNIIANKWM
jgi:hypothetical protein